MSDKGYYAQVMQDPKHKELFRTVVESQRTAPLKVNAGKYPFQNKETLSKAEPPLKICVRRHWNDWRIGSASFEDIDDLHWDDVSGGVRSVSPQPFVHGYVSCDKISGEVAHSCSHGEGPHRIKVCLVKKDNKAVWSNILAIAGPKP